jgi:hypothetical protein
MSLVGIMFGTGLKNVGQVAKPVAEAGRFGNLPHVPKPLGTAFGGGWDSASHFPVRRSVFATLAESRPGSTRHVPEV